MSVITCVPEPHLWTEICKEFEAQRPPFTAGLKSLDEQILIDYDASKHTPVFYGDMHVRVHVDPQVEAEFDSSRGHTACVGYAFVAQPQDKTSYIPPPPPDKKTCSPREYLEYYVFPILLPAMEQALHMAKSQKCFERKRTKFSALDFLTEFLYKCNPEQSGRECITFNEIPFVKQYWESHPRPPLPKSVLLSEPESVLLIQSFWRGYKVRLDESVGELRQWQKDWREGNCNINTTVNDFWANKMPNDNATNVLNNNSREPSELINNSREPCELSNRTTNNSAADPCNGLIIVPNGAPCADTDASNNCSSENDLKIEEFINDANASDDRKADGERKLQGTFSINAFKRVHSMCDVKSITLPYLWEKFDAENYSIWLAEYKYPEELAEVFKSCNLVAGMYQRLDTMREDAFASTVVFETENRSSSLSSVWIWRGLQVPLHLSEDLQMYDWTRLDPDAAETQQLVGEYFTLRGEFGGKKFREGMFFK